MKLTQNTSPVEISGAVTAPSQFQIAGSKEAFKILSSGLYNNKIRAIIRELSCNAYDAHVAAGKTEVPFEVHLPTSFEPFFSIKDQGTGLEYRKDGCFTCLGKGRVLVRNDIQQTEECPSCNGSGDYDAVKELYCTYFSSNKSHSNLFVGALGLGSKSPFCYTEGFSVTNTYLGMTRVYSCFMNEEGLPTVLLQIVKETPEAPNGVEVSFPVKQKDVWEFKNQAKYVWEFFNPAPQHNIPLLAIKENTYRMKTKSWGLRNDGANKPRAIQGMVQYSMGDIDTSKLSSQQQQLLDLPLDLFFPIGELSVAASRESLSNDESTIQNILAMLDKVHDALLEDVKAQVAASQNAWEARLKIYTLSNLPGLGRIVSKAFQDGLLVNPLFTLTKERPTINQLDYPGIALFTFRPSWKERSTLARRQLLTRQAYNPHRSKKDYDIRFDVDDERILFVINDLGFGMDKYIHYLVQNPKEGIQTVYYINRREKEIPIGHVKDLGLKIVQELGNPPMMLLSEIKEKYQEESKAISIYEAKPVRKLLVFGENLYIPAGTLGWAKGWENAEGSELPEGTKYYVAVKALVPEGGYFYRSPNFKEFISLARRAGLLGKSQDIYGVPIWNVRDLDDSWVELVGYVTESVKKLLTPKKEVELSLLVHTFEYDKDQMFDSLVKQQLLEPDSPLDVFCNKWLRCKGGNTTQNTNLFALYKLLVLKGLVREYTFNNAINLNDSWFEVLEAYPLLGVLNGYNLSTERLKAVVEYVKLIDEETVRKDIDQKLTQLDEATEEETYAIN